MRKKTATEKASTAIGLAMFIAGLCGIFALRGEGSDGFGGLAMVLGIAVMSWWGGN